MVVLPEGRRRLCISVDVEDYSSRKTPEHFDLQRRLAEVVRAAVVDSGVRWGQVDVERVGDGQLLLLPVGISEDRMISEFALSLAARLTRSNRVVTRRLRQRLRVAVTQGLVHPGDNGWVGDAVIAATRLRDSEAARTALAEQPDADLALIVADDLYRDVLSQGYPGLDPDAFTEVTVTSKASFHRTAWLCVPVSTAAEYRSPPQPYPVAGTVVMGVAAGATAVLTAAMLGMVVGDDGEDITDHDHDGSASDTDQADTDQTDAGSD